MIYGSGDRDRKRQPCACAFCLHGFRKFFCIDLAFVSSSLTPCIRGRARTGRTVPAVDEPTPRQRIVRVFPSDATMILQVRCGECIAARSASHSIDPSSARPADLRRTDVAQVQLARGCMGLREWRRCRNNSCSQIDLGRSLNHGGPSRRPVILQRKHDRVRQDGVAIGNESTCI